MFSLSLKPSNSSALLLALLLATALPACHAAEQAEPDPAVKTKASEALSGPVLDFRGTISGDVLDLNDGKGEDTKAVQEFLRTGKNPYNEDPEIIKNGYTIYSTACSGCHGHHAEGKLGPALADDYWTYPANVFDKGLFETIYGGGQGMMGPQRGLLSKDEILQVMSWLRSIYSGDPKKAKWKN